MVKHFGHAIAGAACAYALALANPAAAADSCQLKMVASLDFTSTDQSAVVLPVTLNNLPVKMIVDTGGVATTISDDWARDQRLRRHKLERGAGVYGYDGRFLDSIAYIPSVQTGPLHASDVRAIIEPGWLDKEIVGTLGPDFFMQYDVELDFAAHKMNLFSQDHCPGQVVYWTHDPAAAIPVKIDGAGHIVVDVTLDGKEVSAIVDTGATTSVLKMAGATSLFDLSPDSPGVTKVSSNEASGGNYKFTFKTLTLAGINFSNPTIYLIGDANPGQEMMSRQLLLGGHQLSKLHLFISYKEHMLYATAAGAH
ncbi:MAG TPA: aspartyl protease family protein [Rhizomicrobium sp.]|nr:aspartyl protease family protein [Rhizomicrobium sp.]